MLISMILIGLIFWLFFKCVGFAIRMTWGLAKILGVVLMTVALPVAGVCVLLGLGTVLLVPAALLLLALGLLRASGPGRTPNVLICRAGGVRHRLNC